MRDIGPNAFKALSYLQQQLHQRLSVAKPVDNSTHRLTSKNQGLFPPSLTLTNRTDCSEKTQCPTCAPCSNSSCTSASWSAPAAACCAVAPLALPLTHCTRRVPPPQSAPPSRSTQQTNFPPVPHAPAAAAPALHCQPLQRRAVLSLLPHRPCWGPLYLPAARLLHRCVFSPLHTTCRAQHQAYLQC